VGRGYKLEFHGTDTDMDTDTDIRDAAPMRLSCNFVNVYTIAYRVQYIRVHARIPNRHPRDDLRAEVGKDVGVDVRVGPVEFQLYSTPASTEKFGITLSPV